MPVRYRVPRRRGYVAMIAMLFLTLVATMAIGFYATTTTSVQVAKNDYAVHSARFACDSTFEFIRFHLANVTLTAGATPAQSFTTITNQLRTRLDNTANMGGRNPEVATVSGQQVFYIPGRSASVDQTPTWINLGNNDGYGRVEMRMSGNDLVVKIIGQAPGSQNMVRAIQLSYRPSSGAWASPGRGIIARSGIVTSNGAKIEGGDVTIATASGKVPLSMSGGSQLDGNVFITPNTKTEQLSNGAKLNGTVTRNIAPPTFPTVNTALFEQYVPSATAAPSSKVITASSSIASNATLTNIRIKANANTSFGNSVTLNGVIYIESPNKVSFGGGSRINGIIVTDGNRSTPLSGNQITIDNGVRIDTLATLNAASFPITERIEELRQLSGALILAENYSVVLAGGARSYGGSMVGSRFDISNGYRGTITGNLINLDDTEFRMMGGGQLTFTGGSGGIPGLVGTSTYALVPSSYSEVDP